MGIGGGEGIYAGQMGMCRRYQFGAGREVDDVFGDLLVFVERDQVRRFIAEDARFIGRFAQTLHHHFTI